MVKKSWRLAVLLFTLFAFFIMGCENGGSNNGGEGSWRTGGVAVDAIQWSDGQYYDCRVLMGSRSKNPKAFCGPPDERYTVVGDVDDANAFAFIAAPDSGTASIKVIVSEDYDRAGLYNVFGADWPPMDVENWFSHGYNPERHGYTYLGSSVGTDVFDGSFPYYIINVNNEEENTVSINWRNLQYRTYENQDANYFQGSVSLSLGSIPFKDEYVERIVFRQRNTSSEIQGDRTFWSSRFCFYDCRVNPCQLQPPQAMSSINTIFYDDLVQGDYTVKIETAFGDVVDNINFPGKLELPVVSSASMESRWEADFLVLQWRNPTDNSNWQTVDQLRIQLTDLEGNLLFSAIAENRWAEEMRIPADVIDEAERLLGEHVASWEVQTRANGPDGNNFARGRSDSVPIGP